MDFRHDLAEISKKELLADGVSVPTDWDDYDICLSYIEMKYRCFDSSVPYKVLYSKELLRKLPDLTQEEQAAIKDIEKCLMTCQSLTPYMSKLIKDTDISKSDFLLKNWNIYHLHLEKLSLLKIKYTKPNLLFFQPKGNVVHFIDVKPHPKGASWFDRDMLEIIYSNWPWLLNYEKGIKLITNIPDNQVHNLTKKINTAIDFHNGILFTTNFGVVTTGNSAMAVTKTNKLFNELTKQELYLKENSMNIKQQILNELGINVTEELDYELIIEDNHFVAYEKHSHIKIKLFRAE